MKEVDIKKLGKSIAVICPHDDDGIIGCGGLLSRLSFLKDIQTYAIIMTDGSLGYSNPRQKNVIVKTRKGEAKKAYGLLGVKSIFLDFLDMSLNPYRCWRTPDGKEGAYLKLSKILRKIKPETILIPNPLDRHPDHQATYDIASVCLFQAVEPVAAELGKPIKIKNIFCYKVWDELDKKTHLFRLPEKAQKMKKDTLFKLKSQEEILKSVDIDYKKEEFKLLK